MKGSVWCSYVNENANMIARVVTIKIHAPHGNNSTFDKWITVFWIPAWCLFISYLDPVKKTTLHSTGRSNCWQRKTDWNVIARFQYQVLSVVFFDFRNPSCRASAGNADGSPPRVPDQGGKWSCFESCIFDHAGYFDFSLSPQNCKMLDNNSGCVEFVENTRPLFQSTVWSHWIFEASLGFSRKWELGPLPPSFHRYYSLWLFFICRMCVVWLAEAGLHPPPLYSSIERIKFSRRHVPCARRVGLLCRCAVSVVPLSLFRRPDYGHTLPRVFINTETPFPSFALTRCELYILKQNLDFACKKNQILPALLVVGSRYVSNLLYYRNLWNN